MKRILSIFLVAVMILMSFTVVSFADVTPDPKVTIVNPAQGTVVYSSNLLVSVKVAQKATITVEVFKESITNSSVVTTTALGEKTETVSTTKTYKSVMDKETFISESDLSFYTKKIENVDLGTYKIVVNTLGTDGKVTFSTERMVTIAEKPAETSESDIFNTNQSGTLTFLKNLLTTIFGN